MTKNRNKNNNFLEYGCYQSSSEDIEVHELKSSRIEIPRKAEIDNIEVRGENYNYKDLKPLQTEEVYTSL